MRRQPEPELMLEEEQARAYAQADFEEPHSRFIELFARSFPEENAAGYVLDLGCGPADITVRFARAYPHSSIHGVDGSEAMLKFGFEAIGREQLEERVQLIHRYLAAKQLPRQKYDVIISNSLLHHLRDPAVLWQSINQFARPEAPIFIMDLMRPASQSQAKELTETHAAGEPEILKQDFYRSLLAAYRPEEIKSQLQGAGLAHFCVEVISDRHIIVWGRLRTPCAARERKKDRKADN